MRVGWIVPLLATVGCVSLQEPRPHPPPASTRVEARFDPPRILSLGGSPPVMVRDMQAAVQEARGDTLWLRPSVATIHWDAGWRRMNVLEPASVAVPVASPGVRVRQRRVDAGRSLMFGTVVLFTGIVLWDKLDARTIQDYPR